MFKQASKKMTTPGHNIVQLLFDPVFIGALALYGAATILWMYVLKVVPLAYAYSFMALTFVIVPVFAWFWLGETVNLKYVIGAALIIFGLLFIHS